MPSRFSLLSLAPYRILPPTSGGHLGIVQMHEHLGRLCDDHLCGTADNTLTQPWAFHFHPVFGTGSARYLPYRHNRTLLRIGRKAEVGAVWCEHPYMALSARAVARALSVPFYLRSHNIEGSRFRGAGKRWWRGLAAYEEWGMRAADGVFFVTAEDRDWAVTHYRLAPDRAHVAPYGTPLDAPPLPDPTARARVAEAAWLRPDVPWLYFLGALDYGPNVEAIQAILDHVLPRLRRLGFNGYVLLAGKGLLAAQKAAVEAAPEMRYMGFLPSLEDFLQGCDVMLNPVLSGGGIKTKAVEALAWSKRVVSVHSGAAGLDRLACGPALRVLPDGDWDSFATATMEAIGSSARVGASFYGMYSWSGVAQGVLQEIAPGL